MLKSGVPNNTRVRKHQLEDERERMELFGQGKGTNGRDERTTEQDKNKQKSLPREFLDQNERNDTCGQKIRRPTCRNGTGPKKELVRSRLRPTERNTHLLSFSELRTQRDAAREFTNTRERTVRFDTNGLDTAITISVCRVFRVVHVASCRVASRTSAYVAPWL